MTQLAELRVRWGEGLCDQRSLFVKKHRSGEETHEGAQRLKNAVFVAGLSSEVAHEDTMQSIFSRFGQIHTIAMHPTKVPSRICDLLSQSWMQRSCMVVYEEAAAVREVQKKAKESGVLVIPSPKGPAQGLTAWVQAHKQNFPGEAALVKEADEWMMEFEKREDERQREEKGAIDEDGWTVVSRKKRSGIELQGHTKDKRQRQEAHQKSKKTKDYRDLYNSISDKQTRMEAALSLRDRFEQDKKRVAEYRAKRTFHG